MNKLKGLSIRISSRNVRMLVMTSCLCFAASVVSAATPLAVWNGDFDDATTRNGVTFDVNGNTVNEDGTVTISSSGSGGIKFTVDKTYNYITTVFTVKNLDETAASDRVLVALGGSTGYYTGVYLKSGGLSTGGVNGTSGAWSTATYDGTVSTVADANTTRTFAATQVNAGKLQNGFHLYEDVGNGTSGGTIVYGGSGNNGLYGTQTYDKVLIGGGLSGSTGSLGSMTDLVIISVAIYVSDTDWPLDSAGRQNFVMPVSAVLSASGNSVSALNTVATADTTNNYFVNVPTATAVLPVADATAASNLVFPYDTTITVAGTTLTVTGGMPVKLGSSITAVTGSGVVVAVGATDIDALPSGAFSSEDWTGTVWLKGRTGWSNFDPTAYGNAGSTLRFSGIQGHFAKKQCTLANTPIIELENDSYTYALNLNNGYSFNSSGGWSYVHTSELKGSGILQCDSNGGALIVVGSKWSDFTGSLKMTNKTIWFGYTTAPASNTDYTPGTVSGGIRVASGCTLTLPGDMTNWNVAGGYFGPGTIEISSNNSSSDVPVYLIGTDAETTIVLKGLTGTHHVLPFDNHTIAATVQLDGAVTINSGSTGKTYTFAKLTGSGNFTNTFNEYFVFNDVSEYTGVLSCSKDSYKITAGLPTAPAVGDRIAKVDSTNNKVSTTVNVNGSDIGVRGTLETQNETYGLYVNAAATVGGVSYPTLAQAIDAASAGDTITLSRGVSESVTIDKNLTINGQGSTVNAYNTFPTLIINEGVTLTMANMNKAQTIGQILGGGNLAVSGSNTFNWSGMSGDSNIGSITQTSSSGGVLISGYGTINVSGAVNVAATLTLTPSSATTTQITNGWTIKLIADSVAAGTLTGAGTIQTANGIVAKTSGFYGSFAGAGDVTLNADSTITAPSYFGTGKLAVADGKTLTISPYDYSSKVKFGFDASNTANWFFKEDDATSVTSVIYTVESTNKGGRFNSYGTATATYKSSDESYFGGEKPFVLFSDGCDYSAANAKSNPGYYNSLAWLFVYQKNDSASGKILTEKGTTNDGSLKINSSGDWEFKCNGSSRNDYVMVDGVKSREFVAGEASAVMAFDRVTTNNNRWDALGTTLECAVAEAIGFKAVPSIEEYLAINAALQHKWNLVNKTACQFIPTTASVELGSGATLDLGGYTQTVASFTGGGTVQNGTLLTTSNIYTNNGALAIAAVDNMTVVLDAGATALTLSGDATGVKLTATDAFLASGGTVTVTATGIYDASHTIDISEFPSTIFRFGTTDNGDGTLTIGAATTFEAATYTWSPVGSSTDWTSLANWSVSGYDSVAVLPQEVDTVVFPASEEEGFTGWTVALDAAKTVASATFNADVTLSGAVLFSSGYTGSGAITLGADAGLGNNGTAVTIANDIVVAGSGAHTNILYSYKADLTVSGGLSGEGNLELRAQYDQEGVTLSGANTMTSGSITAKSALGAASGSGRRNCSKVKAIATNAALVWQLSIGATGKSGNTWAFFQDSNETYRFGSIGASSVGVGGYASSCVYEIGALGYDDTLSGGLTYKDRWSNVNTLKKVGGGDLSITMSYVHSYDVNAGTLTLKSDNSRPYDSGAIAFTGTGTLVLDDAFTVDISTNIAAGVSTVPIKVDTGTVAREWEVAIPATSASALVKSGAGTLTLSAAPLAATFEISVEAGKVVVPSSATNTKAAKGTLRTTVGDTFEYEKGPEIATSGTATVEDLASQEAANAVADTYNVTLTEAQEMQGLEAGYYKVVATQDGETTTYTMSVVLDEDEVGVEFGDDNEEPVAFSGTAPTFKLKDGVKKGLYYGVGTITDPTAANPSVTVLAEQLATEDGEAISLAPGAPAFGSGNVLYYKLSVSDTAQTP